MILTKTLFVLNVWTSNKMVKNTINFYNNIYHPLFRDRKFNLNKSSWHGPSSLKLFEKFIKKNGDVKISNMLDVGCAWGRTLEYWTKKNIKCTGVDVSMEVVNYCIGEGDSCHLASATDLSIFKDKKFDLYMATDVYEHLREEDMVYAIEEAKRVTKKYLLIQPSTGPDKTGKLHLTIWTFSEWKKFFEHNNLKILYASRRKKYKNAFLMKVRR